MSPCMSLFIIHVSSLLHVISLYHVISPVIVMYHHSSVIFHISFIIKFEVQCWFPFGNNEACCIRLTLVLIDFALFFCFINCFVNVLLGLICISILSALCIVISQYLLLVQWVMYCKSITFIMLSMKSS